MESTVNLEAVGRCGHMSSVGHMVGVSECHMIMWVCHKMSCDHMVGVVTWQSHVFVPFLPCSYAS